MQRFIVLFFPCLLILSACDGNVEAGRDAFRNCATCHCVTDPRVPEDADWIILNRTTRCINEGENTPDVRRQIEAYLRSDVAIRPLLIDDQWRPGEGVKSGRLKTPDLAGSAFLKAERDSILKGAPARLRLRWDAGEVLHVPAGEYRVVSYIFRSEYSGKRWLITGTGSVNGFAEVIVDGEKEGVLDLVPEISGTLSQEPSERGGVMFRYALRDNLGATVSISTEEKVRCPEILVLGMDGKEVHRASFENTCGKLSCLWKSGDSGKFSRASVVFETGPFSLKDAGPLCPGE